MKIPQWRLLIDALIHPKKHAAYRLLPIGKTMQFLFLLIFFISIGTFINFTFNLDEQNSTLEGMAPYISEIKWLLYPLAFIFLFIFNTALLFIRVSFYAAVGLLLLKVTERRGEYRMLWRTATFSTTLGYLLTSTLSFFLPSAMWITLLGFLITMTYLWIAIRKYPKQPKTKINVPI